ncbi:LysR family transcriptional regulator [Pasteurellaceae bacterium 22721_9_1]
MDKLNAISVFCKVVETQSFTQAAAHENISVAMASKLVAQLEEQLQIRLLQRTTRKISTTEAGSLYYQMCHPLLAELKEADESISNLSTSLQGKLTISVPMDFGLRFIAPNLSAFAQAHPNLQIEMDFSDRRVNLTEEGYDMALRIGRLRDSSLIGKKLSTSTIHYVASPDYLAKRGIPQNAEDLLQHDCLLYKAIGNQIYWEFTLPDGQTQRLKMHSNMISNNGSTLVEMAKAGLGIIKAPHFLIKKELDSGELVEVLAHYPKQTIDLTVLYPNRRYLPAKVKAFIQFLESLNLCK